MASNYKFTVSANLCMLVKQLLELETWPIKSIYTVITNCSRSNIFDLISKLIIFELFFTSLYEMSEEENQLNCQTHKVYVFSKANEF